MIKENAIQILFTMDVEPVTTGPTASGPPTNEEGARRVREYMDVLADYGYSPTFFIHPELGEEQADLFLECQTQGACLGLHIHAAKFAPTGHQCELGGLSLGEQQRLLGIGAEMFEGYFGFRPDLFRPGCFSANDFTYTALINTGFRGGSITIPGRIWPERYCIWAGAFPYPRFVNENFRQLPGDSEFIDIPLSVDMRQPLQRHPLGFLHYDDLRPGGVYSNDSEKKRDHQLMLDHIIRQQVEDEVKFKTIVIDVHNDRNFKDSGSESAKELQTILENIEPLCATYGLCPLNSTFDRAITEFRSQEKKS